MTITFLPFSEKSKLDGIHFERERIWNIWQNNSSVSVPIIPCVSVPLVCPFYDTELTSVSIVLTQGLYTFCFIFWGFSPFRSLYGWPLFNLFWRTSTPGPASDKDLNIFLRHPIKSRFWSPGNIWQYMETFFFLVTVVSNCATGIWWVGVKNAVLHPTMHRTRKNELLCPKSQ